MTTPNGPILFNSTTGSDTAASGLGPSSAVIGSSAELDGTSTVDVSFDGVSLSGISAGDLLYCGTSSGRKFSVIASVDTINETITTDDAWPTQSGVSWSVGGKRRSIAGSVASLDNWTADFKGDYIVQFESGYTENFTSRLRCRTGGSFKIQGDPNAATRPKLITSADFVVGQGHGMSFHNMEFLKSATGGTLIHMGSGGTSLYRNCKFGDSTNLPAIAFSTNAFSILEGCEFTGTKGIYNNANIIVVSSGKFKDCSIGIDFAYSSTGHTITNSIFDGCNVGISEGTGGGNLYNSKLIEGNLFNCVDAGIQIPANASLRQRCVLCKYNVFANSTYGIEFVGNTMENTKLHSAYIGNAFYNIGTSNYRNDDGSIYDDIALSADPFTDAANGDFSLNNANDGGKVLRANTTNIGDTTVHPFRQIAGDLPTTATIFHPLAQ